MTYKAENDKKMRSDSLLFITEDIDKNLGPLGLHSVVISFGAQSVIVMLKVISAVVLARLLSPSDYGVIFMVGSLVGLLSVFKDFGLSMGTIQSKEINHEQISILFWVNVAVSVVLCCTGIVCAPFLSDFYNNPSVLLATIALSLAFIPNGLTIQHQALLKRRMRYFSLAIAEIVSQLCSVMVAIVAALCGAGFWALVYMQLSYAISYMIIVWIATAWVPGLPARATGASSILSFGSYLSLFGGVNYFLRNADNILIGRYWGEVALGFYGKAYELLMLPIQSIASPLGNVCIPVLCRLQDQPEKHGRCYSHFMAVLFLCTMPIVMLCNIHAREMIAIVLGPQWIEAGEIFYYLSFGSVAQIVCSTAGWLYVSLGRARELFRYGSIGAAIFIVFFFVGVPYGMLGVAIAYSVAMLVWLIPCMLLATRNTAVRLPMIWSELMVNLVAMAIGGGASYYSRCLVSSVSHSHYGLLVAIAVGLLFYFAVVLGLFGRWRVLRIVLEYGSRRNISGV